LRFYGSAAECEAEPYDVKPTVEVDELPNNESALVEALASDPDYNASPIAFALEGGVRHQRRRAQAHPDRKQIVVLLSDGFTQDLTCRYSLQDTQDAAAMGFTSEEQIETYVVGFGAPDTMNTIADELLQRFNVLNAVARDGGGQRLFSVKYNDDPDVLHEALTSIRRMAQPCIYELPEGSDPASLNLSVLSKLVPRVDSAASCGPALPGYYYKDTNEDGTPRTVELCPGSCRDLEIGDFVGVWVEGCPTIRRRS
jgi:hypothetical protein